MDFLVELIKLLTALALLAKELHGSHSTVEDDNCDEEKEGRRP